MKAYKRLNFIRAFLKEDKSADKAFIRIKTREWRE